MSLAEAEITDWEDDRNGRVRHFWRRVLEGAARDYRSDLTIKEINRQLRQFDRSPITKHGASSVPYSRRKLS